MSATATPEMWRRYFEWQVGIFLRDGSPLYAEILQRIQRDFAEGGVAASLLAGWEGDPLLDAVALRLLGAVHFRVLEGRLPKLAQHYPSAGGTPRLPAAAEAFLEALQAERSFIRPWLDRQVQTNEVLRSAGLLGGFLQIAQEAGLPLRLLEIGASAGLNQLFDQYRYALGPHHWGRPGSEPLLRTEWTGPPPALAAPVAVAERLACDLAPIDLTDPQARRRSEAFIWPDQLHRRARFRAAARRLASARLHIDRASALPWLERQLAAPAPGRTSVLFHSVMWHYIPQPEREAIEALLARVGTAATVQAPLAWLRMEAEGEDSCALRLRLWPGGEERLLARCGFHGQYVKWLAGPES